MCKWWKEVILISPCHTETGKNGTAPLFACYFDYVDLNLSVVVQTDWTDYFGYLALSTYYYDVDVNNPLTY